MVDQRSTAFWKASRAPTGKLWNVTTNDECAELTRVVVDTVRAATRPVAGVCLARRYVIEPGRRSAVATLAAGAAVAGATASGRAAGAASRTRPATARRTSRRRG